MNRSEQYLERLRQLANGEADPKQVSIWAVEHVLELDKQGEELTSKEDEILTDLQLAGALNENGGYLYGEADFRDWLSKYESE